MSEKCSHGLEFCVACGSARRKGYSVPSASPLPSSGEEEAIDISSWPDCSVPGCRNKSCLSLDSDKCHPHTMQSSLEEELATCKSAWKRARTWGSKQKKRADDAEAQIAHIRQQQQEQDAKFIETNFNHNLALHIAAAIRSQK